MAFNERTAERIRNVFSQKAVIFSEKKMFSGVCFMVDDKMCCGTHIDKKSGDEYLLCRIGEKIYDKAMMEDHCIPMDFTGKIMKGYVFVKAPGFGDKRSLSKWIQRCLDYNPDAKKSSRKK